MKIRSLLAGAAFAIAGAGSAAAQQTVEVVLFAGTSALPVYVAKDKGFFEREGLNVNITPTPNSGFQMSNLIAGKFNIAGTAVDNLIAYMEGQGTAKVDREPDLITIMGLSSTELTIVAQPEYKSIAELKGKDIALDSPSTGFAFVLRHMLEKNGFGVADTRWVPFGGTRERLNALREKKAAAAMISEPFTTQARQEGFSILGEAVSSLGPYQANVQIANRPWARENEKAVVGYIPPCSQPSTGSTIRRTRLRPSRYSRPTRRFPKPPPRRASRASPVARPRFRAGARSTWRACAT